MNLRSLKGISYRLMIISGVCWASSMQALFGKTEVELGGLGVVKEAAEVIARSIATFPTRQMAIAIIGFIAVSQGLFFFTKGLASIICGDTYTPEGKRAGHMHGFTQCVIGLGLSVIGSLAALYSACIVRCLFGA